MMKMGSSRMEIIRILVQVVGMAILLQLGVLSETNSFIENIIGGVVLFVGSTILAYIVGR